MPHPQAIKEYSESVQIFIKKIHYRINAGKNALIGVFGYTGSGKSLSVLQLMRGLYLFRYGKEPSNKYLIEHNFFKARNFMEAMKKVSDALVKKKNFKIGESWLWDEAGIEVGSREWWSVRNKILSWLVQTFRNQRQIIFFTTPSLSMIDPMVRKLLHYYLEAVSINKNKKICIMKPLEMQYNTRRNKIYYHNLVIPSKEGGIIEVEFIGVPKISDELELLYDVKKNSFTGELNKSILNQLIKLEEKENRKNIPHINLTDRQKDILKLLEEGITSTSKIAGKIGCKAPIISANFGWMRRKGVSIDQLLKKSGFKRV